MNDKEVIECVRKLKEHCNGSGCNGCCLKNNGECFIKDEKGCYYLPYQWNVPILKPKLTDDEKIILRNLDKKFKWLASDKDGAAHTYSRDIVRRRDCWIPDKDFRGGIYGITQSFPNLFQWCKWEDEPYLIEDLLKE